MRVCGLIKCAGLWADKVCRFLGSYTSSIDTNSTVGFAMFRLPCYVLHKSEAKPGTCTCFYIFVPSVHKRPVDGQHSSPGIVCFLSEALL